MTEVDQGGLSHAVEPTDRRSDGGPRRPPALARLLPSPLPPPVTVLLVVAFLLTAVCPAVNSGATSPALGFFAGGHSLAPSRAVSYGGQRETLTAFERSMGGGDPSIALSESAGHVFDAIDVTGTGFFPNSNASITFGNNSNGSTVNPSCATDAGGSLTSGGGSGCPFSVPPNPAGPVSVMASSWNVSTLPDYNPAGAVTSPFGIAYDSGTDQLFVADDGTNNVSVISPTTGAVFANVSVGVGPSAVVYDSGTGQVFVADTGSDNVSVINDSGPQKDTVVATIPVGVAPSFFTSEGLAYDSGTGQVFVANTDSSNISVIDDSGPEADTVVATVTIPGSSPEGLTYDSGTGQVFVADGVYWNFVSVINDSGPSADSVTATIAVPGVSPCAVAYDPAAGEVFVVDVDSNSGNVINDTSLSLVANFTTLDTDSTLFFDPAEGILLASGIFNVGVDVISAAAASQVGEIPGPPLSWADGFAVDSTTGQLYATSLLYDSNNISAVSNLSFADALFSLGANLSYVSSSSGSYGTIVAVNGTGFLPNAPITFSLGGTPLASVGCTPSDGTGLLGTFGATPGSPSSCDFSVPAVPSGPYTLSVSDGTNVVTTAYSVESTASVLPSSGSAGSRVLIAGYGFGSSSSISVSFGGSALPVTCSTDSNGSFPGDSGTGCSFTVPGLAAGSYPVVVSGGGRSADLSFAITTLSVTPTGGVYGSRVSASGTGYAADSEVNFSVGGLSASSDCWTDSDGDFPGTTGTPCTFTLPGVPNGANPVVASVGSWDAWNLSGAITVGQAPEAAAYDPANGTVFVTNSASDTVSVISVARGETIATIPVGISPAGIAYGAPLGELFVANSGSNDVTIINATNYEIVGTSPVLAETPEAVVFDPENNTVFVGNSDGSVSALNATTGDPVATVDINGGAITPLGEVYDSGTNQVFVAGEDGLVGIIDAGNYSSTFVDTRGTPAAIAYDSGTDQLWVVNSAYTQYAGGGGSVDVISDQTDSFVTTIYLSGNPGQPTGIAYDPAEGELFVSTGSPSAYAPGGLDVDVLSDSSDAQVGVVGIGTQAGVTGVGAYPQGVLFVPEANEILVADGGSSVGWVPDNVSVLTPVSSGNTTIDVSASLSVASAELDANQTLTVSGYGYAASQTIDSTEIGATPLTCSGASLGTCRSGVLETSEDGSFVAQFPLPGSVAPGGPYTVTVTDDLGNSATSSVTVLEDPTIGAITASRDGSAVAGADVGQNTTFEVGSALYGTGTFTYRWSGLPPGCASRQTSFACSPTDHGTFAVSVAATDSNGYTVTSPVLNFVVDPDPTVAPIVATNRSGGVDAGESVGFSTVAAGGTGQYDYYTWSGLPSGCLSVTSTATCSGSALPAGTYEISVSVRDSNNFTSAATANLTFVVDPDPTAGEPAVNRTTADVGQWIMISDGTSSPGDRYAWSGLPEGCPVVTTSPVDCQVTTAGTYAIQVNVTDANGYTVASPVRSYVVYPDPSVTLTASASAVDVGQTVTLTPTASNGSGFARYTWSNLLFGCQVSGAALTCTPTAPGSYREQVTVTDSNGVSAQSNSVEIMVAPAITAAVSSNLTTVEAGSSVALTSSASGGTGALTYAWEFGDGSTGSGPTVDHTFASPGTYTVDVWVNDTVGGSVERTLTIVVTPAPAAPTAASGLSPLDVAAIAAAVLLVAGALAAVLLLRRRRPSPRTPAPSSSSEDDATEETGVEQADSEEPSE